jgi:hypothetical protein
MQIHSAISRKINKDLGWDEMTLNTTEIPQSVRRGIAAQDTIGWDHIRYGRISKALTHAMSGNDETGATLECTTARKLIRGIWDTFLKLWKQQNQHIYGQTTANRAGQLNRRLLMKVKRCYDQEHILPINDRTKVFQGTIEDVLAKDQRQVMNWIKLAEKIIKTNKCEQKHEMGARQIMEQYVKWQPPDRTSKTRNGKSKQKERNHKEGLKPD